MDSIKIDAGIKRVCINDDPARVIAFNPNDVAFAERFYAMYRDMLRVAEEYDARAQEIDAETGVDDAGLPINAPDKLSFMRESVEYWHGQIDALFGEGTSETVFQGALNMDAVMQFLEGMTRFFQQTREEKTRKYRKPAKQSRRALK